jgi:LPXTG-motif cell wall-anchored protein
MDPNELNQNPLGEILQEENPPELPKPRSNRTFTLVIVVLIVLTLVALIFLIVIAPRMISQQRASQAEQAAQIYAANTATSVAATEQAYLAQLALTPSQTPQPSATFAPTGTPLLAQPTATSLISAADQAITATLGAMLTQVAGTKTAAVAPTSSALPSTGAGDFLPIYILAGICVLLIASIFILRALRARMHTR